VIERIVLVVGLPGSGKSVFARQLAQAQGYIWLDDPSVGLSHEQLVQRLRALNASASGLAISDPLLCYAHNREAAIEVLRACCPQAQLEWVYFENDPEQCLANALARNASQEVRGFIAEASKVYAPPPSALPVYAPH
jgi:predicted kinase